MCILPSIKVSLCLFLAQLSNKNNKIQINKRKATRLRFAKQIVLVLGRSESRRWLPSPTLSLYYEGRVKRTTSPETSVYVLRTLTACHMVRFLFPLSCKFPDPVNFATVLYIYPCDTHSEPGLPVVRKSRLSLS